jgi:transcriptional regulator with PAS, ATPase and Fis domain
MKKILLSWVGGQDLGGNPVGNGGAMEGPVVSVLSDRQFDAAVLLFSGYEEEEKERYKANLRKFDHVDIHSLDFELDDPTDYRAIHEAVVTAQDYVVQEFGEKTALSVHVSSGTPAMHAVWVLLSSTRFPAELIQSSKEVGVRAISIPYDISAEVLADAASWKDRHIERLAQARPEKIPGFEAIIGTSRTIVKAKVKANKAARSPFPVLLQAESGTGKELFARAIHGASTRSNQDFVPVNCSALPESLAESEFFGHERGAFTDAKEAKRGYFQQADGGTLFLDEIGELPVSLQAKLLRVLEEKKVRPVGSEKERAVDVRIIAATNRDLAEQVRAGSFRSDLYYRIAGLVIGLPPLRDREGDLGPLIDHFLSGLNDELDVQPEFEKVRLTPGARNELIQYSWPGNVRQLKNVLTRLAVWAPKPIISKNDVHPEIQILGSHPENDILGREMVEGFEVDSVVGEVMGHYISRALRETPSRRQAAKILGLEHANTLTRRIDTYQQWVAEE